MGGVNDAAAAVRQLCDKVSAKLDGLDVGGLAGLVNLLDPNKIEQLLRKQIVVGALPDILRDKEI